MSSKHSREKSSNQYTIPLRLLIFVFFLVDFSNEQQKERQAPRCYRISSRISVSKNQWNALRNPVLFLPWWTCLQVNVKVQNGKLGLRRVICGFFSRFRVLFFLEVLLLSIMMIPFWHAPKRDVAPLIRSFNFYFFFKRKLISISWWVSSLSANFRQPIIKSGELDTLLSISSSQEGECAFKIYIESIHKPYKKKLNVCLIEHVCKIGKRP